MSQLPLHRIDGTGPPQLGSLYRQHAQTVARWASRLGGLAVDVEDVVQEVFLVVQRRLPEFRGEGALTTWLYRITANVVRHERRKNRWRRFLGLPLDDVPSPRLSVVDELERREEAARLYRVLDGLREKYRTVLILFELEGLSGEEIAELTGIKLATVWVQLHRARAQFLARMKEVEP